MSTDCWIPVDLAPELAPLAEEYDRRAADVADAAARRDALDFNAENRARRLALQEAYADGGADAAAELPVPLTEEERKVLAARADAHVAAAKAALYAFNEQAVQAVREHAPQIKADLTTSRASAEAEREDAERVLAEAQARAHKARRDASYQERTEQWIDALCEGRGVMHDRPTRFRLARRPEVVPTLTEIYNRNARPPQRPIGLVEVGPDASADEAWEAAQANAAATKASIEALDAAEKSERDARLDKRQESEQRIEALKEAS